MGAPLPWNTENLYTVLYNHISWHKGKRHYSTGRTVSSISETGDTVRSFPIRGSIYSVSQKKLMRDVCEEQRSQRSQRSELCVCLVLAVGPSHSQKQTARTQPLGVDQLPAALITPLHREKQQQRQQTTDTQAGPWHRTRSVYLGTWDPPAPEAHRGSSETWCRWFLELSHWQCLVIQVLWLKIERKGL